MQLTITSKKPFEQYTESEQQAILSRGQAVLAQKLEQGESRSLEDTFCMLAYQRTQREVKFKPTVEKILKEKPLTKAQKLELLNESITLQEAELTDKHRLVLEELVGKDKEYWLFTLLDGSKELMKLTKTNIKKKVKELSQHITIDTNKEEVQKAADFIGEGAKFHISNNARLLNHDNLVSGNELEFFSAMTKEVEE